MVNLHLGNSKAGSKRGVTTTVPDAEPMQTGSMSLITAFAVNQFHWKIDIVMKGPIGKRNSFLQKPKPFSALTREELESELGAREIYEGKTKKELQNLLDENLHGVSRVPALLFTNPSRSLESLNLGNYEVLPCEPMQDIAHHIENLLTELPSHIEDENCREKLVEAVTLTTGKKETKRAVDFRCSLLTTSFYVQGTTSSSVQSLLDTMVDMQDILYKEDKHRSPRLILPYHTSSWYHLTLPKHHWI